MVTDPPYIPSGASAVKLTSISQFAPAANEVGQALAEIANAPPATMLEISNGDPPVFERMRGLDGHRRLRLCWYVRFTGERLAIGAVPVITLAVVVLELFAKLGSVEVEVTVAVSLSDVPLVTVTTKAMVAECPLVMVPRLHVTTVVPPHVPWLGTAETNVALVGNASITETPVASAGPLSVTVMLIVSGLPTFTGSGMCVKVIFTSEPGCCTCPART
jgi:hypothetical protein